ncbi:MAG: hypothetical protein V1778_02020 [bacterium]
MRWALLLFCCSLLPLGTIGCETEKIVGVEVESATAPDLRVQVWDSYQNGPYQGALVQSYLPGGRVDSERTGSDGWTTGWLLVPRNAGTIQISVSYWDRHYNAHTDYFWVDLRHGDTPVYVTISTWAP